MLGMRMTLAMQQVLRQALAEPTREFYGGEVGKAVGLPSGTVTPILARLEAAGMLVSRYEDVDPRQAGRPRRRYYTFTPDGAERARHELARTYQAATGRGPAGGWHPAPGAAGGAL
jgi:DNA-binding PadR family transcriptional regulator